MTELLQVNRNEYNAIKAVNFSSLKHIDISPKNYKWRVDHKEDEGESAAMGFGTVCHVAHLEPEKYDINCVIVDGGNRSTKAFDKACVPVFARNINAICVTEEESKIIDLQRKALRENNFYNLFFPGDQKVEHAVVWLDSETGITCKALIDDFVNEAVVDLKTSAHIDEHSWLTWCYGRFYHAQIAMYHDALMELDGKDRTSVIIKLETKPPYDVIPYVLPLEVVNGGRNIYLRWLWSLKTCWETGTYPGVANNKLKALPIKQWALEAHAKGE